MCLKRYSVAQKCLGERQGGRVSGGESDATTPILVDVPLFFLGRLGGIVKGLDLAHRPGAEDSEIHTFFAHPLNEFWEMVSGGGMSHKVAVNKVKVDSRF